MCGPLAAYSSEDGRIVDGFARTTSESSAGRRWPTPRSQPYKVLDQLRRNIEPMHAPHCAELDAFRRSSRVVDGVCHPRRIGVSGRASSSPALTGRGVAGCSSPTRGWLLPGTLPVRAAATQAFSSSTCIPTNSPGDVSIHSFNHAGRWASSASDSSVWPTEEQRGNGQCRSCPADDGRSLGMTSPAPARPRPLRTSRALFPGVRPLRL